MSATIMSVQELLSQNLRIPGYQRPYRWTTKNISDLLAHINNAIEQEKRHSGFKYRIGSVILHNNVADGCLDLVDGQQRVLSLILLALCLDLVAQIPLLDNSSFSSRETQQNIRANHRFMSEWLAFQPEAWRQYARDAFGSTLEAVVITVDRVEEAFQLFDSQNTRGRMLDPHDLLKAYHLRAMHDNPYEMRHVVTRWEEFPTKDVREAFARYLFPCLNWELGQKTVPFTAKEIEAYKGIDERSGYTYAVRARRAAPCFQIGEPFIEGEDFFLMVEHYLELLGDIQLELRENQSFKPMRELLEQKDVSAGWRYARELFLCALLAYYDRFHIFDERAVRKLFAWAFMIRVDMTTLGYDTINKYAVGEYNDRYTNNIAMFSLIARARHHTDVADVDVRTKGAPEGSNDERQELGKKLEGWFGGGSR